MAEENNNGGWLSLTHPYYSKMVAEWQDAMTFYRASLRELRTAEYLIQRKQGEPDKQFRERCSLADFTPLFAIVADSYIGRITGVEAKTERSWGALGEAGDVKTAAGRLNINCDGEGTNYATMLEDAAGLGVVQHEYWCLVDGIQRDSTGEAIGEATIRLIEPSAVPAWGGSALRGSLWVKVKHQTVEWENFAARPQEKTRYRIYTLDGYQDFEKDDQGREMPVGGFHRYGGSEQKPFYYYRSAEAALRSRLTERILPLFRVRLPMRRFIGSILAGKNGVIFNQESERDNILRVANTPTRVFAGNWAEFLEFLRTSEVSKVVNQLQLDPNATQKHYYMAPDIQSAQIATEVLKEKRETFFLSAFRFYEDSVRGTQRTATEVEQDAAAGEWSFLNTLATSQDELEAGIGLRLEQIYFPNEPSQWGQFSAKRARDFKPIDAEKEKDRIMKRYFGMDPLPVDVETRFEFAKWIAEQDGVRLSPERIEQLRTAVRAWEDQRTQAGSLDNLFS